MTDKHTVVLELTLAEAEHLLGFKHVISKDAARPTLQHIQFTVEDGDLIVVATDSYRLGYVRFYENAGERRREIEKGHDLILEYASLELFIKTAITTARAKGYKARGRWNDLLLVLEADTYQYKGTFSAPDLELTQAAKVGDFKYPNWKQLMPDDASDTMSKDTQLSAFSHRYLSEMAKFMEPVSSMNIPSPVQQLAAVHQTNLKPWLFRMRIPSQGIVKDYLLMPVRISD